MILQNGYAIETIAFILLAILFIFAEKRFGARKALLGYRYLPDVAIFIVVLMFVQFSRLIMPPLFSFLDNLPLGFQSFLVDLPLVAKMIASLILVDFGFYVVHYGLHNSNILWRAHIWHHSPQTLTWLTGFRSSFLHVIIYGIPQIIALKYLFQFKSMELGFLLVWGLFFQLWTHSNVRLPSHRITNRIEWIFTTPRYHRVHHSASDHMRRNLGFMLTIWDRMFGTYQDPAAMEDNFALGLDEDFHTRPKHVIGI